MKRFINVHHALVLICEVNQMTSSYDQEHCLKCQVGMSNDIDICAVRKCSTTMCMMSLHHIKYVFINYSLELTHTYDDPSSL